MKLQNINIQASIEEVKILLEKENNISPFLKAAIKVILTLVKLLGQRFKLNSTNIAFLHRMILIAKKILKQKVLKILEDRIDLLVVDLRSLKKLTESKLSN